MKIADKKLSLNEIKDIQIEMLVEFDNFCRKHHIKYFLSYGTLLGAIRHKGYIPWDDDVDVMVPRPEIERLKHLFNSKGKNIYKITDTDNDANYDMPFPRMTANNTYSKTGLVAKSYGVNIDIYPIDAFPDLESDIKFYRKRIKQIRTVRRILIKLRNRLFHILPIRYFPGIRYCSYLHGKALASYDYISAKYVHVCAPNCVPLEKKHLLKPVEVEFEGHSFWAPSGWQEFLTMAYGNYMELPPEDKRKPYHRNLNIYWKQN